MTPLLWPMGAFCGASFLGTAAFGGAFFTGTAAFGGDASSSGTAVTRPKHFRGAFFAGASACGRNAPTTLAAVSGNAGAGLFLLRFTGPPLLGAPLPSWLADAFGAGSVDDRAFA